MELFLLVSIAYINEGCYNAGIKAGQRLGDFYTASDPVNKCARTAFKQGFKEFSLRSGGVCRGGNKLQEAYMNSGTSLDCINGLGAGGAVNIYSIKQKRKLF